MDAPRLAKLLPCLRQIWPLLLGNILQWYEFAIYGYLVLEMQANFFPGSASSTWLGYAVSFVVRPLGGLTFGWAADRLGRRAATITSLVGMLLATVGQGLLPSTRCCGEPWGSLGVVLLVLLRAVQGFCTGGEEASIIPYLAEVVPQEVKCLGVVLFLVTGTTAFMLASGAVALLTALLSAEQMFAWGWRLPFLVSLIPGLISLWGRRGLPESEEFEQWQQQRREVVAGKQSAAIAAPATWLVSARTFFNDHGPQAFVLLFGAGAGANAVYQTTWIIAHLQREGVPRAVALGADMLKHVVVAFVGVFVATLSDAMKTGPAPAALFGTGCIALGWVPVSAVLEAQRKNLAVVVLCITLGYGVLLGLGFGTFHLFFAELFPTRVRACLFGIVFNMSFSYFGGFSGFVSTALVQTNPLYPSYYTAALGFMSFLVLLWSRHLQTRGVIELAHFASGKNPDHSNCEVPPEAMTVCV